jgi:hypothetical protein
MELITEIIIALGVAVFMIIVGYYGFLKDY